MPLIWKHVKPHMGNSQINNYTVIVIKEQALSQAIKSFPSLKLKCNYMLTTKHTLLRYQSEYYLASILMYLPILLLKNMKWRISTTKNSKLLKTCLKSKSHVILNAFSFFFFFKTGCQEAEAKSRATHCECTGSQEPVCRSLNWNLEYILPLKQCDKRAFFPRPSYPAS